MKKMLLAALIAGTLFACGKEEHTESTNLNGVNSITLTIDQGVSSKSISDQKENTEYAVIGSARIYFIDNVGTKVSQRDLTAAEITSLTNTETTPGNKSIIITGVPNTATSLFFMANVTTTDHPIFPSIDGTSGTDARIRIDKLQANAINVPMSGHSSSFQQTAPGLNTYTTNVTITPIVSRLEIGKTTCVNQSGTPTTINADIVSYKLSGVFINNVYPSVLLSGAPYTVETPGDIKTQAGWGVLGWENYFGSANSNFPYYSGGSVSIPSGWVAEAMVDYCTPTAAGLIFYPDQTNGSTTVDPTLIKKQAWAYQVCPSGNGAGAAANIPHIILKLTDVVYVNDPFGPAVQYVTVTKYKDKLGNSVAEFAPGNVYRISDLVFSHNEASNVPYEKNITVTATVIVSNWVVNEVDPDWI